MNDQAETIPPEVLDVYREHALKWVRCPSCGASGTDEPGVTVGTGMDGTMSFSCGACGNAFDLSGALDRAAAETDVLAFLIGSD